MSFVSVEIQGERQLLAAFERLGKRQSDMRWAWPKSEREFYEIERRQFDSEGQGRWPPLSLAYARAKAIEYPGRPIMRRDGFLRESLTTPGAYVDAIREFDKGEMVIGTTLPYAAIHHLGKGRMPERRLIDLSSRDIAAFTETIATQFRAYGSEVGFEVYA